MRHVPHPVPRWALHHLPLRSAALGGALLLGCAAPLTVQAPGHAVVRAADAPSWEHQTLTVGGATAWVERSVGTGNGQRLRIHGSGWTHPGTGGSTVAVKLGSSPSGGLHRRTGDGVIEHPSASGDDTIWALLAPGSVTGQHVFRVEDDGSFSLTLDLPGPLTDAEYLTVALSSGRFAAGDTARSVTSAPIVVGSAAWSGGSGSDTTCTPTQGSPSFEVRNPTVALGGVLQVRGAGWCNPAGGGSRIGVKIDEGAYARLDDSLHSNRTIWAVIEADDRDGTFDARITLPDGTTATSAPALGDGAHTLRVLSGTLAPGDTVRSLERDFVIGEYRPSGLPDPVDAESLTAANTAAVRADVVGSTVTVHVPGRSEDDWVFVSGYTPDGSPRYPWQSWHRLGPGATVSLPVPTDAPTGPLRLVVQDGNQGSVGTLLGWTGTTLRAAPVTGSGPEPSAAGPAGTEAPAGARPRGDRNRDRGRDRGTPTGPTNGAGGPGAATPAQAATLLPDSGATALTPPAAPATNFVEVGQLDRLGARARLSERSLRVRLPEAVPGATVHLTLYGTEVVPVGWATLDARSRLTLDLAALPVGAYRFTAQGTDGALLGWVDAALGDAPTTPTPRPTPVTAPGTGAPRVVAAAVSHRPGWVDGTLVLLGAGVLAGSVALRRRAGAR